jgi:hypothetical protein
MAAMSSSDHHGDHGQPEQGEKATGQRHAPESGEPQQRPGWIMGRTHMRVGMTMGMAVVRMIMVSVGMGVWKAHDSNVIA